MEPKVSGKEFIRLLDYLRAQTGGKPRNVKRALDENPDLAISLLRLHEIREWFDRHRKFGRSRIFTNSPPELPKALSDFEKKWSSDFLHEYARDWRDVRDFIRHHHILIKRTGNRPNEIATALDKHPHLHKSIRTLHDIRKRLARSGETGPLRTHPEFLEAFADFTERWNAAHSDLINWRNENIRRDIATWDTDDVEQSYPSDRDDSRDAKVAPPASNKKSSSNEDGRRFDPDRDNVASIVEQLEESLLQSGFEDELWRADGLKWLRETVGLDFQDIQTRWRDLQYPYFIPSHVPDKRHDDQEYGLFTYLKQASLAYIIGADLAAIALCRATTELLLKFHYSNACYSNEDRTKLSDLMKKARKHYPLPESQKLDRLIKEADGILHIARPGENIAFMPDRARVLVKQWLPVLRNMILQAPVKRPDGET
jgi:hypothetical protein